MSQCECLTGILACLYKAEEVLGADRQWNQFNDAQGAFLHNFIGMMGQAGNLPEIESILSKSADEINRFMAERGFSIQLDDLPSNSFGVASVLDLLVKWMTPGERGRILDRYDAIKLKANQGVHIADLPSPYETSVASIVTQSGDTVKMCMIDDSELNIPLSMTGKAMELSRLGRGSNRYEGLVMPMISLDVMTDISWILGMTTNDSMDVPWTIDQALQQNKLRLNQYGARAQSATAMAMRRLGLSKQPFVVDKPFLIWFERPGISLPLFVAHVTEEDWKDPGDLDKV